VPEEVPEMSVGAEGTVARVRGEDATEAVLVP
jgi:hypothetical protein